MIRQKLTKNSYSIYMIIIGIGLIIFIEYLISIKWNPPPTFSDELLFQIFQRLGYLLLFLGLINLLSSFLPKKDLQTNDLELLTESTSITLYTNIHEIVKKPDEIIISLRKKNFIMGFVIIFILFLSIGYIIQPAFVSIMNNSTLNWEFLLGIILPLVLFAIFILFMLITFFKQYLRNFEVVINKYSQVITIKTLNLWSLLFFRKEYNIVSFPLDNLKSMKIEKSIIQIPEWDTVKVADVFFLTLPNDSWYGNEKLFKKIRFSDNKIKILSYSEEKWLDDFKLFLVNFCNF